MGANQKSETPSQKKKQGGPVGNQFWKKRTKHGRNTLFSNSHTLRDACYEYFEEKDKHKYIHQQVHGKDSTIVKVPTMLPYSLQSMCIFLGITIPTWKNYAKRRGEGVPPFPEVKTVKKKTPQQIQEEEEEKKIWKEENDFFSVCTHVENIIYVQKFEGASVGAFKESVMIRDLGLVDKTDTTSKGNAIGSGKTIIKFERGRKKGGE
jgi:hypothetical protein